MKKALSLILAIIMALMLYGCSADTQSNHDEENEKPNDTFSEHETSGKNQETVFPNQSETTEPCNQGKIPSDDLIQADLQTSLTEKNEYATVTNAEISKSLTGEGTYSATLAVTAETKYADWQYEVKMSYTMYDQGWFLDRVEWLSDDYQVVRSADLDTILQLANAEEKLSYLSPISGGALYIHEVTDNETLLHSFTVETKLLHAVRRNNCVVRWNYDASSDNWVFAEYNSKDDIKENTTYSFPQYDFSGTWTDNSGNNQITIDNFSLNGFDLKDSYLGSGPIRFQPGRPASGSNSPSQKWFSDGMGNYICMQFYETTTKLAFCTAKGYGLNFVLFVDITCELPLVTS